MTHRVIALACLSLQLGGCTAATPPQSPATIGVHSEVAGGAFFAENVQSGGQIAADVGFESVGCCGLGLYIARTTIDHSANESIAKKQVVTGITEGGLALSVVVPETNNWFRLRLRGGLAGEPPHLPEFGRTGYSGSAAVLVRIIGRDAPVVGGAAAGVDLFGGYAAWSFGRMHTTAGVEGDSYRQSGIIFGVRILGDYGVDFQ